MTHQPTKVFDDEPNGFTQQRQSLTQTEQTKPAEEQAIEFAAVETPADLPDTGVFNGPLQTKEANSLEDSIKLPPPVISRKINQSNTRRTPKVSDVSIAKDLQKQKLEDAYKPRLSQKRIVSTVFDHKAIKAFDGVRQ